MPLFLLCVWGSIELYHHVSFGVIGKNNRISVRPFGFLFRGRTSIIQKNVWSPCLINASRSTDRQ